MLFRVASEVTPHAGAVFFQYLYNNIYNKGVVLSFDSDEIEVDFGDSIHAFKRSEVSIAYSAQHADHMMTTSHGEIRKDYRAKPQDMRSIDDLMDFVELLG